MRVALRHVADAGADLERRRRHVEPEHPHSSTLGDDEPEQRLQHRALAGAVRAEQADGSGPERGRDVAQRRTVPVGHRHRVERDDGSWISHLSMYTDAGNHTFALLNVRWGPTPSACRGSLDRSPRFLYR